MLVKLFTNPDQVKNNQILVVFTLNYVLDNFWLNKIQIRLREVNGHQKLH